METKGLIKKEFRISTLSVDNKTTVFVLSFILFIGGLIAYKGMPTETFPEIVSPEIYVGTAYPGYSPVDIEKLVTRPLEKEINGITGIEEINSTSVQGYSTIQVKFNFDVTPDEALRKVKDKVDQARSNKDFPKDLPAEPNVFELNFAELIPVLNINLSGEFSPDQLKQFAEYLEDKIEALPEISKVEIRGMDDKELRVSIDQSKLELLNLSFDDIANAIRSENVSVAAGDFLVDEYRRNIRVIGEFKDPYDIGNVIVKNENAEVVYLKDIADIYFGEVEKESYAREFGQPVVMLDVLKRSGENLIIVSDKINNIIREARQNYFPENLRISITNDQSDRTRNQVAELENSIIFGVLLVVAVLMFFMGLRNALFVGIAIPLSMLISFMVLSSLGVTLNTIVLFSLVLALGMLVDNGIVVVENIYRLLSEGKPLIRAAKEGVGEVAAAIIASTATTVAAFIPLAFWPGIFGEFMKYLPITLMIVLGSSLFVALVINPVLTSVYMKLKEDQPNMKRIWRITAILMLLGAVFITARIYWLGNLLIVAGLIGPFNHKVLMPLSAAFQNHLLPRLEEAYERLIKFALRGRNPIYFFIGTILLLIVSFALVIAFPPKVQFFPVNEPNRAEVYIELPIGTDVNTTNQFTLQIEQELMHIYDRFTITEKTETGTDTTYNFLISSIISQVGKGASDPNQGPSQAATPHKAKITVDFVETKKRRGVKTSEVLEDIREALRKYPGAQITVSKDRQGPPAGAPISIELSGDNYEQLYAEAEAIKVFIDNANIFGIEELKLDVDRAKPELPIIVDRTKARTLGVSTYQIGDALRTALFGREVSTFKDGNDDYPINIRYKDQYRYDLDRLMDTRITFRDQATGKIKQIPISAVAQPVKSVTFSSVKRHDLKRTITITSNVLEGVNATATVQKIKRLLQNYELPDGITLRFTGEQEKQSKELGFLSKALMVAVFLIFLILVAQFNSASTPLIIMITVVFSLIGVFLGLVIFRQDFVIILTMIGIISLAGVVVNNAIVLIDYANLIMARRKKALGINPNDRLHLTEVYNSIVEAGKKRLRPVLLTAITTILGLIPLATGMNIDFIRLFTHYNPDIYFGGDNVAFWGPMSWTVIYGLTFATFLTLIIVPVMLYLLNGLKYRLGLRIVKTKV
ncbi:efflux RND transporter permease subunit [Schleiferia thermophila]|uniref:Multidrug efflux pump subunit AcrB n=1 Tax=Schleiferia thermophila TaxID=884107 RepID=A0A369A244_9FLAO|nr:efflux RND transporter permease subunit [Schleiferia thermophila]RCX03255.1 multidrug efflux pump subunit AcrB [Schleiferia thermophila]GCD80383.1 copper transporter [Schleiferia thermophila]